MPRIARVVAVGLPHHITQRGNYRQPVFLDDDDRECYLSLLQKYGNKYGLTTLAYCLMSNHIHLIAVPEHEDTLARALNTAHMRYSQYFNKKLNVSGHLWQGRFYSCVLDETHLIAAAGYVEKNPVRAGTVAKPWEWKWSSAMEHIGGNGDHAQLELGDLLDIAGTTCNGWKKYLDTAESKEDLDKIRQCSRSGRPMEIAVFVEDLERTLNVTLQALPRGRPRK